MSNPDIQMGDAPVEMKDAPLNVNGGLAETGDVVVEMGGPPIEAETPAAPEIERFRDVYEKPICAGFIFAQDGHDEYYDSSGEKSKRHEGTKIIKVDEDGYEWKMKDDGLYKRKAVVDRDMCRDDGEHEWIKDRDNPLPKMDREDDADYSPKSIEDFMSEEDLARMSENFYFDDFDKVVKNTFYNASIRQRGRMLVQQPEDGFDLAREKSVDTIQSLTFAAMMLDPDDVFTFFDIMCTLISGGVEAAKASDCFHFDEGLATVIIIGMVHVLQCFKGPKLEESLTRAWDGLSSWCMSLAKKYGGDGEKYNFRVTPKFHNTFGVLLDKATRCEAIRKKIGMDRSLLRYLAQGWSWNVPVDHEGGFYSSAILLRLAADKKTKDKLLNLILRAHEGMDDLVAEYVMQRIEHAADIHPKLKSPVRRLTEGDADFPQSYLKVLFEVEWMKVLCNIEDNGSGFDRQASLTRSPFYYHLIRDDFFGEITRVIRYKFVSKFPSPDSSFFSSAVLCATTINEFYADSFEHDFVRGILLKMAVSAGYIWHLLKLSTHVDSSEVCSRLVKALSRIIGVIIPAYLIRSKVVANAVEDFRRVYSSRNWEKVMAGPLAEEWAVFRAALFERAAHKHFYDEWDAKLDVKRDMGLFCDNLDCLKTLSDKKTMRCGGCKVKYYCSKQCQTYAWTGHKTECKAFEDESKSFQMKNDQFLEFCVRRDVMRHLPGIRKLAETRFGTPSLTGRSLHINYSNYPPVMDFITPAETQDAASGGPSKLDEVLFVKCNWYLPGIDYEKKDITSYVPVSRANAWVVPEAERPATGFKDGFRMVAKGHETGNALETVPFDRFDKYLVEMNYEFEPWVGELFPKEKRVLHREIIEPPPMPAEYVSDKEDKNAPTGAADGQRKT